MCGGIDDGYSEGIDHGNGDESALVIIGGEDHDVAVVGPGSNYGITSAMISAITEAMMCSMDVPYHLLGHGRPPVFPRIKRKVERTCLLPGCDNMTTHRGGYCCADHCLEHRKQPIAQAGQRRNV